MRDEVTREVRAQAKEGQQPPPDAPQDPGIPTVLLDGKPIPGTPSWGKAPLARMIHVDSALRESMRLSGFVARGIMKIVVAPCGVTLPDGTHIPYGTKVGIQAYSVHRDNDLYEAADTYDAFRFVAHRGGRRNDSDTEPDGMASVAGSETGPLKGRGSGPPQALVSTSPTFLAFSHGPNAW